MSPTHTRTTVTLSTPLYDRLKIHSYKSGTTISQFIESAILAQLLEDLEDIEDAKAREGGETISFDDFVEQMTAEGLL